MAGERLCLVVLAAVVVTGAGCRLLGVEALPCEVETDCPYPLTCVRGGCAPAAIGSLGTDAGSDEPVRDAGQLATDAGAPVDDAGSEDDDAGQNGNDAGLSVGPDCDGPGAVREDFSGDLSRWAMSAADASIAIGVDAALHVAPPAGTSLSGGMTSFFVLDEQGLRARVVPMSGPPPADGYFKLALRALAEDPASAYDRIELQWSADGLRANLEEGASDVQIGVTFTPYDPLTLPVWRIRRVGGEVVLEVSDDSGSQVVEVARAALPLVLMAGAPSFQANGGSTGFEVAIDDINTGLTPQPLCALASMPDSFADGAFAPELAVGEQLNGCTVSESGGALRFHIDAAIDDSSCRVVSRRSFTLANSSLTVALAPITLRMDGVDPPAAHMTFGVELAIDGAVQIAGGFDARTPYCAAPSYANAGSPLDALPAALRLRESGGVIHCETLDGSGAVVSDLPQAAAAPIERVTPIFVVRAFDALPEAIDLGMSIVSQAQ